MRRRYPYFIFFILINCCFSCSPLPQEHSISPAFYHWKQELSLLREESNYLRELECTKLYVRYFDVTWDNETKTAVPASIVEMDTVGLNGFEIIPVVYVTNEVMIALPESGIASLADNILKKIQSLSAPLPAPGISEIQIDCDWTGTSRESYFKLLKALKVVLESQNIRLSTTLRLHQYHDPQTTGVPPVDRVMLMFYNMGEVNDYLETNSIVNLDAAANYLDTPRAYPLPMDLALPIFQWGCIFREGKLVHLSNNLESTSLNDPQRFVKTGEKHFTVLKSTYLQGYFLYKADEIRLESVSYDRLMEAVGLLKKVRNTESLTVSFYHLDTFNLNRFPAEQLEKILLKFSD